MHDVDWRSLILPFSGFGKNKEIHKKLVAYLEQELGDWAVNPNVGWEATFDQVMLKVINLTYAKHFLILIKTFLGMENRKKAHY